MNEDERKGSLNKSEREHLKNLLDSLSLSVKIHADKWAPDNCVICTVIREWLDDKKPGIPAYTGGGVGYGPPAGGGMKIVFVSPDERTGLGGG